MIDVTQVLNVSNLTSFLEEVPHGTIVRVEVTEQWRNHIVTSHLTIHGVGRDRGLVELLYSVTDLSGAPESRVGQMLEVSRLVREYLQALGYILRGGRYAKPDNLTATEGTLECIRWEKKSRGWVVRPSDVYHRVVEL